MDGSLARRRSGSKVSLALAGIIPCLVAVTGCRSDGTRSATPAAVRFIEQEGSALFEPSALVDVEIVTAWTFGAGDRGAWTLAPQPRAAETGTTELVFDGFGAHAVSLERAVAFAAETVDAITVVTRGAGRGRIAVEWRREGESFSNERRVDVGLAQAGADGSVATRLPLFDHAAWQGIIAGLRIRLDVRPALVVQAVRAVREPVSGERLAAALASPCKVDLGWEVRNALLALPGVPIRHPLNVTEKSVLRFGYGIPKGIGQPVTFRALARREGESEPVEIFTDRLEPAAADRWHEAAVELAAGTGVEITLATELAEGVLDPRLGLPAFAHPEVLPRGTGTASEHPHLVLISLDTLRADRLSLYGYTRPTSPGLDAWAARHATVFETAVAAAPWTLPAHVSMLSGLDAHRHGVNHPTVAPPAIVFLAERLRQAGYRTVAITGGGFVHPRWGFAQGFDRYLYYGAQEGFEQELPRNLERALQLLAEPQERPLLLFFHTYAIHNPYRARQPYFNSWGKTENAGYEVRVETEPLRAEDGFRQRRRAGLARDGQPVAASDAPDPFDGLLDDLYDSGVAHVDAEIGRLLAALAAPAFAGRTATVITSDHGEMLGEHGLLSHLFLYDENLLIPLLIADPAGRAAGRRVPTQVRTVDVVPTLLELAGLEPTPDLDGVSLAPFLDGREAAVPSAAMSYAGTSNWGIALRLQNRLKYVFDNSVWPDAEREEELYDLRADPREQVDLAASANELEALRQRVRSLLESGAPGLRIHFENAAGEPLRGRLLAPFVNQFKLKRAAPDDAGIFTFEVEGRTSFEIPPGARSTIWIEGIQGGALSIEIDGPVANGRLVVETAALADPQSLELVAGRWQTSPRGLAAPAPTGITVAWQGARASEQAIPTETDRDLRERLRALGYLQ